MDDAWMQMIQILGSIFSALITASLIFIAKTLAELNTKMAVVIEKVDSHERRIEKLEEVEDGRY